MTTPMMQQYRSMKREHPDGILFFRMGDFFEMFQEDAERASRLLGLTLTSRSKGDGAIPMAGVPVRAAATYVNRLVRQGEKVVICDQIQDPSEAKGIVDRAITRVVTPGTVLEDENLQERDNNYLCAVLLKGPRAGLAWADLSTGEFVAEEVATEALGDALARLDPAECLLPEGALAAGSPYQPVLAGMDAPTTTLPDWRFDADDAERSLKEHFGTNTLDGFGVSGMRVAIGAAGAALHYLRETQRGDVRHVTRLLPVSRENRLVLDRTTRASLELTATPRDGERRGSLLWVLDRTLTPMGARLLKRWLLEPLAQVDLVRERQDAVSELVSEEVVATTIGQLLDRVQDMDRLLARIACGRGSARELVGLRESLAVLPDLAVELSKTWSRVLRAASEELPDLSGLAELLERALLDEVPATVKEGGMLREGFDPELDELRSLGRRSREWLATFQAREQERSGIPSLKVGFNKVFGYYLEITNTHRERVPAEYIRKQTLRNAERYITPELKEYEERILGADERIKEIEYARFQELRDAVNTRLVDVQRASDVLARLDALLSFATVARERRFVRPDVDDSRDLVIEEGRHPVLDAGLTDEPFVPNDLRLEAGSRELVLLTGPNMAGKSTYIRQAALLVIMAQAGSFVPASSARIGIVDRVFTRIGASDELARGNSTFMVEMIETANILNNATDRSLVILDEVGRGTSTHDGLAIAWAITEHLVRGTGCRALFATHYHQLVDLADSLPGAVNMNVAVREWGDRIVFLHRIVEGGTDRSYGIHVARLAGLPASVLDRAEEVLEDLEARQPELPQESPAAPGERQLGLFSDRDEPLRRRLEGVDPDRLTPMQALELVQELKRDV